MTTPNEMREQADMFGPTYDELITPFTLRIGEEAVARLGVKPGTRFLDVAAGGGALSIPAARAGAQVLATDISQVLLDRLSSRAADEGITTIETRAMDGHNLEIDDDTFDFAGSQLGIMLFPDRPKALKELARVTRPGGKGLMVVFGPIENVEVFSFFMRAMAAAIPGFTPPPGLPLFSLADPEKLTQEMIAGGFTSVEVDQFALPFEVESGTQVWETLTSAAPPIKMMVGGLTDQQKQTIEDTLNQIVNERIQGGIAALNMQMNVAVATK